VDGSSFRPERVVVQAFMLLGSMRRATLADTFPRPAANLQNAYAIRFGIYAIVLMFPRKHKDRNVSEHETCPPPVRVFSLNDSGPSAAQIVLSEDERAQLERWPGARRRPVPGAAGEDVMACAEPPAIHLDQGHNVGHKSGIHAGRTDPGGCATAGIRVAARQPARPVSRCRSSSCA